MPLSDHEQRLLEQMERALYQEDPKFATSLRHGRSGATDKRRLFSGVGMIVAGLVVVLVGVSTGLIPVGVLGFAVMVFGAWFTYTGLSSGGEQAKGEGGTAPKAASKPKTPPAAGGSSSGFMDKLEERWRKRREEGPGQQR